MYFRNFRNPGFISSEYVLIKDRLEWEVNAYKSLSTLSRDMLMLGSCECIGIYYTMVSAQPIQNTG